MKKKTDEKAKNPPTAEAEATPAEKEKPEAEQPAEQPQDTPEEKPEETPAPAEKSETPQPEDEASNDAQPDENGEEAEPEHTAEQQTDQQQATEQTAALPEETPASPDKQLRADLLAARSQLAAYTAGVRQDMIADAVTLATAQAQANGEVTEEAVAAAMGEVLKRHPEWKADAPSKKKSGGFRLGADPDAAAGHKIGKTENTEKKRWNRFK